MCAQTYKPLINACSSLSEADVCIGRRGHQKIFCAADLAKETILPAAAALHVVTFNRSFCSTTMAPLNDIVPPGVVTGDDLIKLLTHAKENGYAIPAFNCTRFVLCSLDANPRVALHV